MSTVKNQTSEFSKFKDNCFLETSRKNIESLRKCGITISTQKEDHHALLNVSERLEVVRYLLNISSSLPENVADWLGDRFHTEQTEDTCSQCKHNTTMWNPCNECVEIISKHLYQKKMFEFADFPDELHPKQTKHGRSLKTDSPVFQSDANLMPIDSSNAQEHRRIHSHIKGSMQRHIKNYSESIMVFKIFILRRYNQRKRTLKVLHIFLILVFDGEKRYYSNKTCDIFRALHSSIGDTVTLLIWVVPSDSFSYNRLNIFALLPRHLYLSLVKSVIWTVHVYIFKHVSVDDCKSKQLLLLPHRRDIQGNKDTETDTNIVSLSKQSRQRTNEKCEKLQLTCSVVTDSNIDLSIHHSVSKKSYSEVKDDYKSILRQNTSLPDASCFSQKITVAPAHAPSQHPNNSLQTNEIPSQAENTPVTLQNDSIQNNGLGLPNFSEEDETLESDHNANDIPSKVQDTHDEQDFINVEPDGGLVTDKLGLSAENSLTSIGNIEGAYGGQSMFLQESGVKESCHPDHDKVSLDQQTGSQESLDGRNESEVPIQSSIPEPPQERPEFPTPAVDDSDIQRFEPMMAIIDKIAIGERVPPQITMRYEMLRFCTLRSFPKENKPFITRIAQAGFYYANTRDEVVCYCCAKRKSDWQETDIPLEVHRQLNPNCRFLNHNNEVNVSVKKQEQLAQRRSLSAPGLSSPANNPLIAATAAAQTSEASRQRNIGQSNQFSASINNHISTALSRTQTSTTLSQPTTTLSASQGISQSRPLIAVDRPHGNFSAQSVGSSMFPTHLQSVGINSMVSTVTTTTTTTTVSSTNSQAATVRPPKYPAYATQAQRDTSFRDCSELVVPAHSLAEAGFFYAGFGDCCRCFQCGVGLRHWSAEDDPWIEHSRWSRNCAFVKEKKGEEFVNLVQMAVEYQQNQQNQQQQQQQNTPGTGAVAGSENDVEQLLHTDAAQSVLEMGYSPALIQRAIRECLGTNGGSDFTAAMLMEKIFAFEESPAPPTTAPPTPNPCVSVEKSSASNTVGASSRSQGFVETASHDSARITATSEGTGAAMASSQTINHKSDLSTGISHRREQHKEQKKLKEENERLKQQSICTQCKQNGVSIVFLPCGHLVTCEQCAEKVRYCTERNCGKYIKGTVRTYVA